MPHPAPLRLTALLGNSQKLDGGAMFGNAPRALWSRWIAPDALHRIPLACRCLLIEEPLPDGGVRRVLLEAGIGAFFEPALRERFGVVEAGHVLLDRLAALGLTDADIDVVVLSHLHFDHAGGLLSAWAEGEAPRIIFPRATYVVSEAAWARALAPHSRDRQSFIPALHALLAASGRLERIIDHSPTLGPAWRFHVSHGHTPGLLLTELDTAEGPLVFAADLIPGKAWVNRAITMGYDRFPELLIDEKTALLEGLVARGGRLFFTHDPEVGSARVTRDAQGRFGTEGERPGA
jgi:glyoxylase-like metal-dependent hydrolase (beta-lactamase superfamily II)